MKKLLRHGKKRSFKILENRDNELIVYKFPKIASELSSDINRNSLKSILEDHLGQELWLPHRLDRITRGLMIFAKSKLSCSYYCDLLKERKFNKIYLARVNNYNNIKLESICGLHKTYLVKKNQKAVQVYKGGKPAFLDIIAADDSSGLLLIKLLSGRYHQIRVMLANLGIPVEGDWLYGDNTQSDESKFFLESALLGFYPFKEDFYRAYSPYFMQKRDILPSGFLKKLNDFCQEL